MPTLLIHKAPVIRLLFLAYVLASGGTSDRHARAENERAANPVERWTYLSNAELKVGFLRSHGGALAYLGPAESDVNYLNHYDHGRLVQQSYYGDADGSRWVDKPWRYNPVQGGSYRGLAASLSSFHFDGNTVDAKTIPRHWASGALLNECSMEQKATLDGPVLSVRYRFRYDGETAHQTRHQETPAVFVAPSLATLVTYSGEHPWTGDELATRTPGWPNESVVLAESWAAYVGDDGVGIGVYVPGVKKATCYRFQGGNGSNCSYIAPLRSFALEPGLDFHYEAHFTTGTVAEIREQFAGLRRSDKARRESR
ncbi:MAG: hypothetical protein AAGD07_20220 [Planctomycetota bacterium]